MTTVINKLRSIFLSPESQIELALRTIYHKILSTQLYFLWQKHLAKRSYRKYRSIQHNHPPPDLDAYPHQPRVTFLLNYQDKSLAELQSTLRSIQSLQSENWEVVVISSNTDQLAANNVNTDARIRLTRPDPASLSKSITSEYVLYCEAGDRFFPTLLKYFYAALTDNKHADLLYFDTEYYCEKTGQLHPLFKPTVLSPALLLSINYLSRCFIHQKAFRQVWSQVGHQADWLCQEYEMVLRLCEAGINLHHIPEVLMTQDHLVKPDTAERQAVLTAHLSRQGLKEVTSSQHETGIHFSWANSSPSLAIIILSKNNYRFLKHLIPALLDQPYEGQCTLNIVDNGSDDPATTAYYHELQREEKVTIIPYPKPFNYSEAINLGVSETSSELVLLLNDDMALINDLWLDELTQWAIRPDVGVVSAKLMRKNRTIQHAGIILGLTGFMGHIYLNASEHYHGLLGSVDWYRNYLAMTGACQMVRREVFSEVGGYDENYVLAFGDIDFCLKVHQQGYQNVYTPFAQLFHYEGSSRGYTTPVGDVLRGYEQLETYLIEQDPYFNPNLTYTRIPKCLPNKQTRDDRQAQIDARKRFYLS